MKYRADIDGLRTVAVVPVVLFHAGLPWVSGGFVGVDVFFVISGYLITNLILSDINSNGFSIASFYRRRILRIFPALSIVLFFCLILGYLIYAPDEYARLGNSIPATTFFYSNFYFWKSINYFEPSASTNALLHTWSLSVEEQFYIFYPMLVVFLTRVKWPVRMSLTLIAVASLILAMILVPYKPSAAFYLLPTRTWELLVGGIVALSPATKRQSTYVESIVAIAGVLFIFIPMFTYNEKTSFPGFSALPPVIGAALIIWNGRRAKHTLIYKWLSSRPMTLIGTASYSLYLWHVPLLVFTSYLYGGKMPQQAAICICFLSLLTALASLYIVERPFRRPATSVFANAAKVAIPSLAMLTATIAAICVVRSQGAPERFDAPTRQILAAISDKIRHHAECMSNGSIIVSPSQACHLGSPDVRPTALLWGDSHAMVTATAMEKEAQLRHAAFLFAASADCPIGLGFAISDATERGLTTTPSYRFCKTYNAEMMRRALADPSITSVVLSSRWSNWRIGEPANPAEGAVDLRLSDSSGVAPSMAANRAIFERGFTRLVRSLLAANKRVFIVMPVPEPTVSVPQSLYIQRFGFASSPKQSTMLDYEHRHARILTMFNRIHNDMPHVNFINPTKILCTPTAGCPLIRNGKPVFFDHNHLSVDSAQRTAPLYAPVFS